MLHRLMEAGLARQRDPDGVKFRPVVELTAAGVAVMKGEQLPPASLADLMPRRAATGSRAAGTNPRTRGSNPRAHPPAPTAAPPNAPSSPPTTRWTKPPSVASTA